MTLIKNLNRRYATKQMNGQKVPKEKVDNILEAIRLAPTSMGLQAFKAFVIEDQALKEKIYATAATGQPQIPNASQLIVFAANRKITKEIIDDYMDLIYKTRNLPEGKIEAFRQALYSISAQSEEENFNWAARQVYIALGFGLVAAADEQIDSVPIEGFNPAALDELLELKEKNLGSVCLLAIGYKDEEADVTAKLPKVRKSRQDLFEEI